MKTSVAKFCLLAVALGAFSITTKANILDFANVYPSPFNSHDNTPLPGSFGSDSGDTPNIGVSYATVGSLGGAVLESYVDFNGGGIGDLLAAATPADQNSYAAILLTPQSGYSVTLSSFEIASGGGAEGLTDQTIDVVNSSGAVLWTSGSLLLPLTGHLTFNPDIIYNGQVALEFGANWNDGVNDVAFSQNSLTAVPEPTTLISGALLLLPFGSSAARHLRKKLLAA